MTNTVVGSGQTSDGAVLNAGDTMLVQDGGTANNTLINMSAYQDVGSQGTTHGVIVNAEGSQQLEYGGQSFGTILNGGKQYVQALDNGHGLASYSPGADGTIINAQGVQVDFNTATNTTINDGGTQNVYGNATGSIINSGGLQVVDLRGLNDPVTVDNTTINSGGVQSIISGSPTNTHLLNGGAIILQSGSYAEGGSATLDSSTDVLTVTDNGQSFSLNLAGDYSSTAFQLSSADGKIEVTAVAQCFCRGSIIATADGETAVEQLRLGDLVVTSDGSARPVRWIGSSSSIVTDANRPVIVRTGAFPDGMPICDLRVTRGHSFLFGQVLIPIGSLINGSSIVWDEKARTIEVFHIGLDRHVIIFANGAPAESYRDDGNRSGFTNQTGNMGPARSMPTCAPVVSHGPVVDRTRARLAERAARLFLVNRLMSEAASS